MKDMMSTTEASKYLGMKYRLFMYYLRRGVIKSHIVGNRYVIMKKDLDAYKNR